MAEAFGIVSGAVGIAAIFTTCVECFGLRLSRWGTAVHVYDDPKLGQPNATSAEIQLAKETVFQILVLLADSAKVSKKFALAAVDGDDRDTSEQKDSRSLQALNDRMCSLAKERQKKTSLVKLTSWALYSKEDFSNLTDSITKLLDNLEQVFPASPESQVKLAQDEARDLSSSFADDKSVVQLVQELAAKVDKAFQKEAVTVVATQGHTFNDIQVMGNARIWNGTGYSKTWHDAPGEVPPGTAILVNHLGATDNARVHNGDSYVESEDTFWN